ncbi:hypothetical protein [Bacillus inaquosorum]|uniref:hypothetical protein n=1 Tax=Bacillus inaquosorum TaxID=483913 RepID=UPI0024DE3508|nr:hypothetical protein [Bacillus inaquosorum]WIW27620.1 hypothetical protein QMC72_18315 [Bacillus inaquosorum]
MNDMGYKSLLIFVEGYYDKTFFKNIIQPLLYKNYNEIKIIEYSKPNDLFIDSYIKSTKRTDYIDYIFTVDLDECSSIDDKITEVIKKYKNVEKEKVYVVIKEIEGWFLAGLETEDKLKLNFKHKHNCNEIIKESFDSVIPPKTKKTTFLIELIEKFKLEVARKNSHSLRYLCESLKI